MTSKKQAKIVERIQYYSTFVIIYLFFAALFFTFASYYRFDKVFTIFTNLAALFMTFYACINPLKLVFLGRHLKNVEYELKMKLVQILSKTPKLQELPIEMLLVDDFQPNVFLISHPTKNYIVFTSAAIETFNIIDFEAIFAYLPAKKEGKPEFIDTIYLLITSLFEKAIILKPFANIFASMTVTFGERYVFDQKAVETTKNLIGYKNMMAKVADVGVISRLGKSFSIVGVFDTGSASANKVVEEIRNRINFVAKA